MFTRTSILDGISADALRAQLAQMQQIYLDLMSGNKVQGASYTQGDGSRSVTYTMANISDLVQAILGVQSQIDALTGQRVNRRAPIMPIF